MKEYFKSVKTTMYQIVLTSRMLYNLLSLLVMLTYFASNAEGSFASEVLRLVAEGTVFKIYFIITTFNTLRLLVFGNAYPSTALYRWVNESISSIVGVGLCSKSLNFSGRGRPLMYWRAIKAFFASAGNEGSAFASRFSSSHLKTAGSSSERRLQHSNSA